MLQRPRIPVLYILIGVVLLIVVGVVAPRLARPSAHVPNAEAARWYETGTNGCAMALIIRPARRSNTPSPPTMATCWPMRGWLRRWLSWIKSIRPTDELVASQRC